MIEFTHHRIVILVIQNYPSGYLYVIYQPRGIFWDKISYPIVLLLFPTKHMRFHWNWILFPWFPMISEHIPIKIADVSHIFPMSHENVRFSGGSNPNVLTNFPLKQWFSKDFPKKIENWNPQGRCQAEGPRGQAEVGRGLGRSVPWIEKHWIFPRKIVIFLYFPGENEDWVT